MFLDKNANVWCKQGLIKLTQLKRGKKTNDTQFYHEYWYRRFNPAKEKASFTLNGGYTLFTDFKNSINGGFIKIGYIFFNAII